MRLSSPLAALAAVLALLTACAPVPEGAIASRRAVEAEPLPAMRSFAPRPAPAPRRSNAEIARDFLDLAFRLESGREVPQFSRFEGPVTVALAGRVPPTAGAELDRLIARLRAEAGIDMRRTGGAAGITIEFLPRARMQAVVPNAACFVVPRVGSWAGFRAHRRGGRTDWATLTEREQIAVFIPSDVAPQEVRDCMHEEMAQALGPLNDLYRLPDSVFNDDNFHTVLTGFDMLILRMTYAPELRSGMSRAEVAARLPAILARLNPQGRGLPDRDPGPTPRAWIDAIETALGPRAGMAERHTAAYRALEIAQAQGWTGNRRAFSHFVAARLSAAHELDIAVAHFTEAARIYAGLPDARIHVAHIDMQMAAFALATGQAADALRLAERATPAAAGAENAALLATLLMIRAEALDLMGRPAEARAARLDSLGWARYGFGAEATVRRRLAEIGALTPAPAS